MRRGSTICFSGTPARASTSCDQRVFPRPVRWSSDETWNVTPRAAKSFTTSTCCAVSVRGATPDLWNQ